MKKYYIYAILNTTNNKIYIGSTSNFLKRKNQHVSDLNSNTHCNLFLQRSWNKYGRESFDFFSIHEDTGSDNDKFSMETYYIENLHPEYNIGSVGGGDNLTNNPRRDEIIQAITEGVRKTLSKMTKEEKMQKFSKPGELNPNWRGGVSKKKCACGKIIAPINETCIDCRDRFADKNPFYGKTHSEESKEKMREAAKAKYSNPSYINPQAKIVMAEGVEYPSLTSCAKAYGKVPATILNRIKSKNFPEFYYKSEMPNDYSERK